MILLGTVCLTNILSLHFFGLARQRCLSNSCVEKLCAFMSSQHYFCAFYLYGVDRVVPAHALRFSCTGVAAIHVIDPLPSGTMLQALLVLFTNYLLSNFRSDPQSSVGPMTPLKQEEHPEMRTVDSGIMVAAWGSKILYVSSYFCMREII